MRIHYLQHVPFETPENIPVWAQQKGYELTGTFLFENHSFPSPADFDLLVVLGGPMGVDDEEKFPWLVPEKHFIKEAIRQRKLVLGICLGAQLIAEAIGGKVYKNDHKEIGWFPVRLTEEARPSGLFEGFPETFVPFHWHADTFQLPEQAKNLASSQGCKNQMFVYEDRVIGLQFHLECSGSGIERFIEHGSDELEPGPYVQHPCEMLDQPGYLALSKLILFVLLNTLEGKYQSRHPEQALAHIPREPYKIIGD
ncbi:type 1 glutamine amidotransferase [Paenibacillus sp. P26]|nr:type 1 glutamine amidotransferase [Paenibacillus sp. P26]UUZ89758.1 type 1 glutamine amidotransferase [Paenibacillus sp. P25]